MEDNDSVRLPCDLPILERVAVRLVVLDSHDRLLLLHTRDPTYPELGTWWELPGGGLEEGESEVDAALRELREETGIGVARDRVDGPTWSRKASFRYRGIRHVQQESVLIVRLREPAPVVDGSLRVGYEDDDYFDHRWWPVNEVVSSGERFYPGRLPRYLPGVLAGERIEEPFELWS